MVNSSSLDPYNKITNLVQLQSLINIKANKWRGTPKKRQISEESPNGVSIETSCKLLERLYL